MAQQTINVGAAPNDGTGTPLRTAFQYTNSNFTELYTAVGPSGNNIVVPGSATITGDLTVNTNVLKVDSTNDRVGIGTATPAAQLHLQAAGTDTAVIRLAATGGRTFDIGSTAAGYGSANNLIIYDITGSAERFRIDSTGVFTFSNVGGGSGTAMTLNATGLGIGASPANGKLIVGADATTDGNGSWNTTLRNTVGAATTAPKTGLAFSGYWNGTSNFANFAGISGGKENSTDANTAGILTMWTSPNGGSPTTRLTIDSTGNVGIGVTPSAWTPSDRALQFSYGNSIATASSTNFSIVRNAQELAGGWAYSANGFVQLYNLESDGGYKWYTATSGIAGNPVSFGSAKMTLDASGNLSLANGNVVMGTSGKGIDFSAVTGGTGTATGNVLNDYEEGTWTGTLSGFIAAPTTPVTATGKYTKIGRQVSIQISFISVDTTGASGRILVAGLPFASSSSPNGTIGSVLVDLMATFTGSIGTFLTSNGTQFDLYSSVSNGASASVTHNAGASRSLWINFTYTV